MPANQLLLTKFFIPTPKPNIVSRPRLIERLNQGLRGKLTLLSAQGGSGKTTLLSEWAKQVKFPVAWVSLDEGDNDRARFLAYFAAALQRISPEISDLDPSPLQTPHLPSLEPILTDLINEITMIDPANGGPVFTLVLDDYHLIHAEAVHKALTFLIEHQPPQMHLVIATRTEPPLPLARLRGRGEVLELRTEDLLFTREEIQLFFQETVGLTLSEDDIATLASRTEGWIAGMQMAAVSMQGRDDVREYIQTFKGSSRYILDYLVEEVLEHQPKKIQRFLLRTSILDRMSEPLCEAVVDFEDDVDGHVRIENLERANLFVVRLDEEGRWYRYHHLFADLLRQRLGQLKPDLIPVLHQRASRWFEANGYQTQAIEHALEAGDFERAGNLIEAAADATWMRSEVTTFSKWVEALPDEVMKTRPLLLVYQAVALLMTGRPLEMVEARLKEATDEESGDSVSGGVALIRSLIAAFRGDTRQSIEFSTRALETLPEASPFLRSSVKLTLGLSYFMRGDIPQASKTLDDAAKIAEKAGNLMVAAIARCNFAELRMFLGYLDEAQEIYQQVLEMSTDKRGRRRPVAGMALIGLGELLRERDQLDAADKLLNEGITLTRKWGVIGSLDGYISLARLKQAKNDIAGARMAIQTARELAEKFDVSEMDDILVAVYQARLSIAQGDLRAAENWARARRLDSEKALTKFKEATFSKSDFIRELETTMLAKLRQSQGRLHEALKLLEALQIHAKTGLRVGSLLEILCLTALTHQEMGNTDQALRTLTQALSLAAPRGYVRTFVDQGKPMARLLYQAVKNEDYPEYAGRLLAAFPDPEQEIKSRVAKKIPILVEPLSGRELDVIHLLGKGFSNKEIAGQLYISLATVKWHTRNIYGKLGVNNRSQAVSKARSLGILEQ